MFQKSKYVDIPILARNEDGKLKNPPPEGVDLV
jgi:hypothetical protein